MQEVARRAIERHLGDVLEADATPESVYDNAFVLAHDALLMHGVHPEVATPIAQRLAQEIAQP
jgi:hypothetical protein